MQTADELPIAKAVDAADDFADVPTEARELIRHSAIMARAAKDSNLKKRTLTNLYNERPTWLKLAHEIWSIVDGAAKSRWIFVACKASGATLASC